MKKIIIIGIMLLLSAIMVSAPNNQETGLDVRLAEYGLDLINYDVSSKYVDNTDHFIVLELSCYDSNMNIKYYKWIMLKEKYNELSEKV